MELKAASMARQSLDWNLTIPLLGLVAEVGERIGAPRIKPHQASQQRLWQPHAHPWSAIATKS